MYIRVIDNNNDITSTFFLEDYAHETDKII